MARGGRAQARAAIVQGLFYQKYGRRPRSAADHAEFARMLKAYRLRKEGRS